MIPFFWDPLPRKECEVEVRLAGDDEALQKTFLIYGEPKNLQLASAVLHLIPLPYAMAKDLLYTCIYIYMYIHIY